MSSVDYRANAASIERAIDRLDTGYEDERSRLQQELDGVTQRWAAERLELESQLGDEIDALEVSENPELATLDRAARELNRIAGIGKWAASA